MEPNFPRCVRQAWDSAVEPPGPETPGTRSSADSGPWPLPFYPKLGHLSWDDPDFNRELFSAPCGLLRRDCPRHRHRAESTSRRSAEPPAPRDTPRPGRSQRRSQERRPPPRSPANAGRQSLPWLASLREGPREPETCCDEDSSERRLPSAQRSQGCLRRLLGLDPTLCGLASGGC
ncbi:PREDICTED: annexin-2 receptor-like [Ceratotherium simum simum]|uniref:Annexin-2 receptor-like n=1 Tax=Ceratotherium simum simum TaxID=73337 RepID=A0ABM0HAN3_CERSS|nr:PREDICTED: annexin-2 receptor-like [Ceratotherium simum simum]